MEVLLSTPILYPSCILYTQTLIVSIFFFYLHSGKQSQVCFLYHAYGFLELILFYPTTNIFNYSIVFQVPFLISSISLFTLSGHFFIRAYHLGLLLQLYSAYALLLCTEESSKHFFQLLGCFCFIWFIKVMFPYTQNFFF